MLDGYRPELRVNNYIMIMAIYKRWMTMVTVRMIWRN